jgi:type II secretory ATPase GspE/PulE/Tfp pilus assembly ATPase PilB-like protein
MATIAYLSGLLEKTALFSATDIETIIGAARENETSIATTVREQGLAREDEFLEALAKAMGMRFVRIGGDPIPPETLAALPTKVVFQYAVIPLARTDGILEVATSNPFDADLVDGLRAAANCRVRLVLSPSEDIAKATKAFYGVGADTVDRMMQDNRFVVSEEEQIGKFDLNEVDQETSIVKFVNQIIWEAHQQGATDIHIEPMEQQLRIRYRVDGVLHPVPVPGQLNRFQAAIISRVKVMANMDIAEKRLPMDGRIGLRIQGQDLDIRVSTMPTVYGESVSLRLLQSAGHAIGLEESGMSRPDAGLIRKIIHRPNGIILVTGPTGSGKSTSLFGYLQELNSTDVRIMTAENPIEYEIPGVNQVLVRPEIGLTFARALRTFLRQDPDIIMVGEIRDFETAEIAIQASLTGHLVFSTLHTNDAAGAFTRLLDMGVEPYLVASAVEAVVAQRLVRRLCPSCRHAITPDAAALKEIGFVLPADGRATIYGSGKCERCRMTGTTGRCGIFEVLAVSESIRSMVTSRAPSSDIRRRAIADGMRPLRQDGWEKVLAGVTTIEEVLRATEDEET